MTQDDFEIGIRMNPWDESLFKGYSDWCRDRGDEWLADLLMDVGPMAARNDSHRHIMSPNCHCAYCFLTPSEKKSMDTRAREWARQTLAECPVHVVKWTMRRGFVGSLTCMQELARIDPLKQAIVKWQPVIQLNRYLSGDTRNISRVLDNARRALEWKVSPTGWDVTGNGSRSTRST